MNVLVINCGSSSLKYQLINSDSEEVLAKDSARESESMADSYIRKRVLIRKSQRHLCQHIKRPFRWFSMHL